MTNEQKLWLDGHRPYRPVGVTASHCTWTRRGMLHTDGTFDAIDGARRPVVREGSFEVGILDNRATGGMGLPSVA